MGWSVGNQWLTPTYEAVTAAFSEQYPTKLTAVPTGGPFLEKIKTMVAAGTPPDVTDTHQTHVHDLGPSGIVVGLSPLLKRDPYPRDYVGWGPYKWQTKQYGVPWAIQSTAIFFNRALFDAAGVASPTDRWTWNDFAQAAQRQTKPGADDNSTIWGAGDQGGNNYQWIDAILKSFGGGVLKARPSRSWSARWSSWHRASRSRRPLDLPGWQGGSGRTRRGGPQAERHAWR